MTSRSTGGGGGGPGGPPPPTSGGAAVAGRKQQAGQQHGGGGGGGAGAAGAAPQQALQAGQSHLDPRKDKMAYFKDNFQTHDEDDFDPKMYYYPRQDKEHVSGMFPGHGNLSGVHPVQPGAHGLASMGSRGPAASVTGLGPMGVGVNVAPMSGGTGSSAVGASGLARNATGTGEVGRYTTTNTSSGLPMAHSGPPGPGPAMHSMGQLGIGGSRPAQPMARAQMGVNINGPTRPQVAHGSIIGTSGLTPSTTSTQALSSAQLRQGASTQSMSMPSPAGSYNPSVDLYTMLSRQGGGGLGNGAGFTPQAPIGTVKQMQMPMSVDGKGMTNGSGSFPTQPPIGAPKASQTGLDSTKVSTRTAQSAAAAVMAGNKQEISLHDMTEFPALGMQQKGMSQKEQLIRLTQEDFPTLASTSYKGESIGTGGHTQDMTSEQLSEGSLMGISSSPQFHVGSYTGAASTGASGKGVTASHAQAFPQAAMGHNPSTTGLRSTTPPMGSVGSSQQYDPFLPHMRLAQAPSKTTLPDRFGLLGLLSVIRMTDPDLNTLALGTDLTTLGLNLNSPDCLYATFTSPFADGPSRKEPEFHLPLCYYMQPPMQPAESKVQLFSDETLIYAFYAMPRDLLQVAASIELYNRDWRFHKALQLWFIRVDAEPVVKTSGYERGTYIFFDVTNWKKVKKENFLLYYDQIAELLSLPKLIPSLQPIGPPGGPSSLVSPAQALNQSATDIPLTQTRSGRRVFDAESL